MIIKNDNKIDNINSFLYRHKKNCDPIHIYNILINQLKQFNTYDINGERTFHKYSLLKTI